MRVHLFTALAAVSSFLLAAPLAAHAQAGAPSPSPGAAAPPSPVSSPGPAASPRAGASPAATPAGAATPDPMLPKARGEFDAWQSGKIDLSRYIPDAAAQFTPDLVTQLSTQFLKPLGAVQTFTQLRVVTTQGAVIHVYRVVAERGSIDEAISWNDAGKIQFIRFLPVP
jgi:hypothetical protein